MKLILCGDWHITDRKPKYRTDTDYLATGLGKLAEILAWSDKFDNAPILQPGDMAHSANASDRVKAALIRTLNGRRVYTTLGQHDVHFHSLDNSNTPSAVLTAALDHEPGRFRVLRVEDSTDTNGWISHGPTICGCAWGQDPQDIQSTGRNGLNVLVMHRMVVESKPLWPGQEGFSKAKALLKSLPLFDLIVTGDNHKSFSVSVGDRHLVNCGSLMRSNVDQGDHEPCCYVYDTDLRTLLHKPLHVSPFVSVMDVIAAADKKAKQDELDTFITSLADDAQTTTSFRENVISALGRYDGEDKAAVRRTTMEVLDGE